MVKSESLGTDFSIKSIVLNLFFFFLKINLSVDSFNEMFHFVICLVFPSQADVYCFELCNGNPNFLFTIDRREQFS